eukprot:4021776-Ditylum_brightwellii.AAC.1
MQHCIRAEKKPYAQSGVTLYLGAKRLLVLLHDGQSLGALSCSFPKLDHNFLGPGVLNASRRSVIPTAAAASASVI